LSLGAVVAVVVVVVDQVWEQFGLDLGDTACHVIKVGTCCPNWHNQPWASSSVVKRVLIVTVEGREFECVQKQTFFYSI
jgi:hypothetical protein